MSVEISDRLLAQVTETVLRSLHIPGTFKGLPYLIYAVTETVKDPQRIKLITKDLYHEIARQYNTKHASVERDIRWAIHASWKSAKKELDQVAGYHLVKRPTNREFIDFVAFYIRSR